MGVTDSAIFCSLIMVRQDRRENVQDMPDDGPDVLFQELEGDLRLAQGSQEIPGARLRGIPVSGYQAGHELVLRGRGIRAGRRAVQGS